AQRESGGRRRPLPAGGGTSRYGDALRRTLDGRVGTVTGPEDHVTAPLTPPTVPARRAAMPPATVQAPAKSATVRGGAPAGPPRASPSRRVSRRHPRLVSPYRSISSRRPAIVSRYRRIASRHRRGRDGTGGSSDGAARSSWVPAGAVTVPPGV